jgi:hypothetical protein
LEAADTNASAGTRGVEENRARWKDGCDCDLSCPSVMAFSNA